MPSQARRHAAPIGAAAALLCACGGAATPPPQNPLRAANVPPGAHDLTCQYAALQGVQGRNDSNSDAAMFFAAFHFPEAHTPPPRSTVTIGFQQVRSRTHEVRDEIALAPEQVCNPEAAGHAGR